MSKDNKLKVLVPIDLQHRSTWSKALPTGVQQAEVLGGELWLMTVVPHVSSGLDWRYATRDEDRSAPERDVDDYIAQAEARMDELVKEHVPDAVYGGRIAAHGTVYEKIVEAAEEIGAELIVMAANRPSLKSFLLGPNTARVARHASCSVQIVRE